MFLLSLASLLRPLRETFQFAYILYIRFANRHCTGFHKKLSGLYSLIVQTRFHSLSLFPRRFWGRLLCVRVCVRVVRSNLVLLIFMIRTAFDTIDCVALCSYSLLTFTLFQFSFNMYWFVSFALIWKCFGCLMNFKYKLWIEFPKPSKFNSIQCSFDTNVGYQK